MIIICVVLLFTEINIPYSIIILLTHTYILTCVHAHKHTHREREIGDMK